MPEFFGQVALPQWNQLNEFYNPDVAAVRHNQALLGPEQLRAAKLANDYTAAIQPAQMNMLLQSIGGLTGQPSGAPSAPATAGAGPIDLMQTQAAPAQAPGVPQQGQSLLAGETPTSKDSQAQQRVVRYAQELGVNPDWAARVQHAESGTYPNSMGAISSAGALGTMQLMPATAEGLGVNPRDPEQNARGGVALLKQLKEKYGDPIIATAAYNARPSTVDAWLAGKGSLPTETVKYIGNVFGGDGMALLNNALSGAHGHPIGGVQIASANGSFGMPQTTSDATGALAPQQGNTVPRPPSAGLEPAQMDDAARASVKQLVAQSRYYMALPDGKGARAAAAIQAQLDNIAGPGGIVDPNTGNVYRVPGSFATRYAAAQATKGGAVGPETQLAANKAGIELQRAQNTPRVVDGRLVSPAGVGFTANPFGSAPPSGQGLQPAPATPAQPAPNGSTAPQQPGVWTPPPATQNIGPQVYKEDREALTKVSDEMLNGQQAMAKILDQRQLLQGLPTGAGGETRTKWSSYAEQFLPPELAARFKNALSLPDASPAQEYAKLSLQNAGTQERQVLGGRGGYRAMQLYQSANPGLELTPTANRDIHNMQLVAMQADQDYGHGLHDWVTQNGQALMETGKYHPANEFDRHWLQQRNPQVYYSATAAMNRQPYEVWSKGLNDAEKERALQIIGRIDPTTEVVGRNGHPLPVSRFLPQQ